MRSKPFRDKHNNKVTKTQRELQYSRLPSSHLFSSLLLSSHLCLPVPLKVERPRLVPEPVTDEIDIAGVDHNARTWAYMGIQSEHGDVLEVR